MTAAAAQDVLDETARALAHGEGANRFVPTVADGTAERRAVAVLALEERHIVASDRRSFAHLAARSTERQEGACAAFFGMLADGESLAAGRLSGLLAACGIDEQDEGALAAYEPLAGCQAYASYVARLALTAEPAEAVLALTANFAAWGGYCARIAAGLRAHYGFDDAACGFFDFFATPAPALEGQARAAVQAGLDTGLDASAALRHGRLLQAYELQFWNTLADLPRDAVT